MAYDEPNDWREVLVFKFLAISKAVHLSLTTMVPHAIINQLNIIEKNFIWNGKIQNKTMNIYKLLQSQWVESQWSICKSY